MTHGRSSRLGIIPALITRANTCAEMMWNHEDVKYLTETKDNARLKGQVAEAIVDGIMEKWTISKVAWGHNVVFVQRICAGVVSRVIERGMFNYAAEK